MVIRDSGGGGCGPAPITAELCVGRKCDSEKPYFSVRDILNWGEIGCWEPQVHPKSLLCFRTHKQTHESKHTGI